MLIVTRALAVVTAATSIQLAAIVSSGSAADMSLTSRHRGYVRVTADYDGSPVYIRRGGPDREEMQPALNIYHPMMPPIPRRYFNGQPITVPR
jgi:hypothetical protein